MLLLVTPTTSAGFSTIPTGSTFPVELKAVFRLLNFSHGKFHFRIVQINFLVLLDRLAAADKDKDQTGIDPECLWLHVVLIAILFE